MQSITDPVLGELDFVHMWKGKCTVVFCGREYHVQLAVQGSSHAPVSHIQRQAYEAALHRLSETNSMGPLMEYCRIDAPEDSIDPESIPYIVHPETLLITYEGGFGLLCSYDYDPEHGLAIYALSPSGEMKVGIQDDIL